MTEGGPRKANGKGTGTGTEREVGGEAADGSVAWRVFAADAERQLRRAGIASAAAEARWIVEEASGHEGGAYLVGLDQPASARGVRELDAMLARRLAGEPLQYVLGAWSFRTLDLFVDPRVLIPRPETEVVVERVLDEIDRLQARARPGPLVVADLGTGSGAIALSIAAERPDVEVWATDVSADALAVARSNLAGLGRRGTRVRLCEGSWFDALPSDQRGGFDVLVSNPPYVATTDPLPAEVRDFEPDRALVSGPTGTEALELLVRGAPAWLVPDGVLVVELAPTQAVAIAAAARRAGFAEADVAPDLTGRDRMVIARRPGHGPPVD